MSEDRYKDVHAAVARLLTSLGIPWEHEPNYHDTPRRTSQWLLEKFPTEDEQSVKRGLLAKKVFPSNYDGLVAQVKIRVYGLCPHHLLSVAYDVSIGYLPHGYVIGLSKLTRLADLELGIAITQEDGTHNLADSLCVVLHTEDIAVTVKGTHSCMLVRGVKQQNSYTETAEMKGLFRKGEGGLRAEFLALVRNSNGGK